MSSSPPASPESEAFYSGALQRIPRFMIAVATVFAAVAWIRYGWQPAAGFAGGCVISYMNFHWLELGVTALAGRITEQGSQESGRGIVLRFLFRYLLMAVGAWLLFRFVPGSLYGLFAGLFLPVAAVLCEAVYEGYAAFSRGI